jgi:hypothetical protein
VKLADTPGKKRKYLKDKINPFCPNDSTRNRQLFNELPKNSKNKNIRDLYRGINEFKKGYQPRNNLAKEENGDLLEDSHNILNRLKNYFSQLLNVHNVSDVRQIEVHTAEPLVPGPSSLGVEIDIAKLKNYKSPGSDLIPAELIQVGCEILLFAIHKLMDSIWNKEEWPGQ